MTTHPTHNGTQLLRQHRLFLLLLAWVLLGFATRWDYTTWWGCFRPYEPVFAFDNVLYAAVALLLIGAGYLAPFRKLGVVVLLLELGVWLFKLCCIKGGYNVGITAGPGLEILLYDCIALALRAALIKKQARIGLAGWLVAVPGVVVLVLRAG